MRVHKNENEGVFREMRVSKHMRALSSNRRSKNSQALWQCFSQTGSALEGILVLTQLSNWFFCGGIHSLMYVGAADNDFTPLFWGTCIASDSIRRVQLVGEISNRVSFRDLMETALALSTFIVSCLQIRYFREGSLLLFLTRKIRCCPHQ